MKKATITAFHKRHRLGFFDVDGRKRCIQQTNKKFCYWFFPPQVQKLDAIVHKHWLHTKIPRRSAYGIHVMIVLKSDILMAQRKNSSDGCCDPDSIRTHTDTYGRVLRVLSSDKNQMFLFWLEHWHLNATSPHTHTHTKACRFFSKNNTMYESTAALYTLWRFWLCMHTSQTSNMR